MRLRRVGAHVEFQLAKYRKCFGQRHFRVPFLEANQPLARHARAFRNLRLRQAEVSTSLSGNRAEVVDSSNAHVTPCLVYRTF